MPRRFDPDRRGRIIAATLDCLAEHGVAGTTHRRIAACADVPLGSMTYHFADLDEILLEAFAQFAETSSAAFDAILAAAADPETALDAIARSMHDDAQGTARNHVLLHELYTLAIRRPAFRSITQQWMNRSQAALQRHFEQATARDLDAYIEGASLHLHLATNPQAITTTRNALHTMAG